MTKQTIKVALYFFNDIGSEKGHQIHCVHFQHGQVQIGYFSEIYHGANYWSNGNQLVINFTVQKTIHHHLYEYGNKFYRQYEDANFPSNMFVAE